MCFCFQVARLHTEVLVLLWGFFFFFTKDGLCLQLSSFLRLILACRHFGIQRPFSLCTVSVLFKFAVLQVITILLKTVFSTNFIRVYSIKHKFNRFFSVLGSLWSCYGKRTLKFLEALLFHRKDKSWLHVYPETAFLWQNHIFHSPPPITTRPFITLRPFCYLETLSWNPLYFLEILLEICTSWYNEYIMWFFFFTLLIWWITFMDFQILIKPYSTGIKFVCSIYSWPWTTWELGVLIPY